ncbi:MAG: hypothetical protein H7Z11_20285 [Verrucomicrobia bacterium]|nr:hypothetical protein [Leptolyngbya sp. ES-bin-22]
MNDTPTKPCKHCKAVEPIFITVQLNLTQWRCGACNYFIQAVDYPGKSKPTKLKPQKDA